MMDLMMLAQLIEDAGKVLNRTGSTPLPDPLLMAAIALRESGGEPLASHHNENGSVDRGLWQINSIHRAYFEYLGDFRVACYTPKVCAHMAIKIWFMQGYSAWTVFKNLP